MSSTIKVNNIQNLAGDDSGIDLSTNDQIILKTNATSALTIDSNQAVAMAGGATVAGTLGVTGITTLGNNLIIPNGGNIGSVGDADAMSIASDGVVTFTQTPVGVGGISSGSVVASTSGTSIDFTGIPSSVKMVTVLLSGVSTNGSSNLLLQLGGSGGIETSGYLGSIGRDGGAVLRTTGVGITYSLSSTHITHSQLSLWLVDASTNTWSIGSLGSGSSTAIIYFGTSSKSLSSALDRVRVTATNGTDTFDAGKINIHYE